MSRKRNGLIYKEVYNKMKYKIISLKIHPGQMLIESQLAEELDVSRTPVREAIKTLIHEGLLVEKSGRLFANKLTIEDVKNIYQVREILEGYAIKLFPSEKDGYFLEKLKNIEKNFEKNIVERRYWESFKLDTLFHTLLVSPAKNKIIIDLINNYGMQIDRVRYITALIPNHMKVTIKEHNEIIKALENNDLEKASDAVCRHISLTLKAIEDFINNNTFGDFDNLINTAPFELLN